jgi:hypothetical protein
LGVVSAPGVVPRNIELIFTREQIGKVTEDNSRGIAGKTKWETQMPRTLRQLDAVHSLSHTSLSLDLSSLSRRDNALIETPIQNVNPIFSMTGGR